MGAVSLAKASFMALDRIERARPRSRSGSANPTRAHVHPNSRKAGTFEDDFFYSYAKGETDRLYKKAVELLKRKNAVRRLARAEGRQLTEDERLVTLKTPAAVRVFEPLTTLARTCAGKVFPTWEIGRASCRERGGQSVEVEEVAVSLNKKKKKNKKEEY